MDTPNDDYDNPWKAGLERYIWDFIMLFCPGLAAEIDWSVEPEFRDQELRQVTRDAKTGLRRLDKLVRFRLRDGRELFVHIEIQLSRQRGFAERMFTCWGRLVDRYSCPVVSIAVLADRSPSWRPNAVSCDAWGTRMRFEFNVIKLLDFVPTAAGLAANFFAMLAEAHFATMRTKRNPVARLVLKLLLTRRAYSFGWGQQRIVDFLNVLDWLMQLPSEQEGQYRTYLRDLERSMKMPYVHSMVRESRQEGRQEGWQIGLQEGRQEGRQEGQLEGRRQMLAEVLTSRFGLLPEPVLQQLHAASHEQLSRWAGRAVGARTLAEVTGI
ncbi:DUF4351 domain-containing protein [Massilia sp. SR12]